MKKISIAIVGTITLAYFCTAKSEVQSKEDLKKRCTKECKQLNLEVNSELIQDIIVPPDTSTFIACPCKSPEPKH